MKKHFIERAARLYYRVEYGGKMGFDWPAWIAEVRTLLKEIARCNP